MNKLSIILFGFGNIGKSFFNRVEEQKKNLLKKYDLEIDFLLIMRSKTYLKNGEWIPYSSAHTLLSNVFDENPLNKYLLVDCTASEAMYDIYMSIRGVKATIIAANKAPLSVDFSKYTELLNHLNSEKIYFFHEATVGAGLPIVKPLQQLVEAGDEVQSICGVFSGTLTYLFANIDVPFSERINSAYDLAYTEPDPRVDLSGLDVARKCLILSRMIGSELSLETVEIESLVPKHLETCSVSQFLKEVKNGDELISNREKQAQNDNRQLCYMGRISKTDVKVGLFAVASDSDFYNLVGTSNLIQVNSKFYPNGYSIKGPGAGVEVTVNGLYSDFLQAILVQKNSQ